MTGFGPRQITVMEIVPSRSLARCREISTGHDVEVPLLPLRVRLPRVGEKWIIDRYFNNWSFAALLASQDLFLTEGVLPYIGAEEPPGGPGAWPVGLAWAQAPVKYWDGTTWSDTRP